MAETDKRQQQLQQAAREMAAKQAHAARQQAVMRAQSGAGAQAQSTAGGQAAQSQNRAAGQQTAGVRSAAAAQSQNRVTGQQAVQAQKAAVTGQQVAQSQKAASQQAVKSQTVAGQQKTQSQNRVTAAGKQQTSQAALSQTKEIENRLVKEVAEMMDQESFGDLVFFDTEASSANKKAAVSTEPDEEKKDKKQSRKFGVSKKPKETDLHETEETKQETDLTEQREEQIRHWGAVGQWFQTFCWMHIPIFGFWYMVVLAIRKKTPEEKRTFARGYVLYRILVFILALTIIYVFYRMGLSFIEQILAYVDAHS